MIKIENLAERVAELEEINSYQMVVIGHLGKAIEHLAFNNQRTEARSQLLQASEFMAKIHETIHGRRPSGDKPPTV